MSSLVYAKRCCPQTTITEAVWLLRIARCIFWTLPIERWNYLLVFLCHVLGRVSAYRARYEECVLAQRFVLNSSGYGLQHEEAPWRLGVQGEYLYVYAVGPDQHLQFYWSIYDRLEWQKSSDIVYSAPAHVRFSVGVLEETSTGLSVDPTKAPCKTVSDPRMTITWFLQDHCTSVAVQDHKAILEQTWTFLGLFDVDGNRL